MTTISQICVLLWSFRSAFTCLFYAVLITPSWGRKDYVACPKPDSWELEEPTLKLSSFVSRFSQSLNPTQLPRCLSRGVGTMGCHVSNWRRRPGWLYSWKPSPAYRLSGESGDPCLEKPAPRVSKDSWHSTRIITSKPGLSTHSNIKYLKEGLLKCRNNSDTLFSMIKYKRNTSMEPTFAIQEILLYFRCFFLSLENQEELLSLVFAMLKT